MTLTDRAKYVSLQSFHTWFIFAATKSILKFSFYEEICNKAQYPLCLASFDPHPANL